MNHTNPVSFCECCKKPENYDIIREKNICSDNGCNSRLAKCCTCYEIWGDENGEFDVDGNFQCEDCIRENEESLDEEDEDEKEQPNHNVIKK